MNNDVVSLLYQIKDNIKLLNNENSKEQLNNIKNDFLEMMELLKLFLISERNTYYGYFLMNMKFEVNFGTDSIAGIKLNTFPPVFESNPLNLCRFKLKEIIYIICHEIDHIVLNHPTEMVKINPNKIPELFHKFNLAADAAVNDRLNDEIAHKNKYLSEPEGIITSKVLEKMFNLKDVKPLENYAYYYNLIKDLELKDELNQNNTLISGIDGVGMPIDYESDNSSFCISDENSEMEDHNWDDGDSSFNIEDLVKEFINSTVSMIGSETRGLMPASFLTQIEKINAPATLSWKQILKKYVGTIVAGKRKTRTRLNRRQPERFDLSGRMDEKIIKIVVAIDTSGSVSDEQITKIFNEIFAIIATRKKEITVIECDAEVKKVYKIEKQSDVKLKVAGRGGTCFSPVIEYINKDKYFRDALLIYFTDGYGEEKIPKPKTYRNIWVLTESDYLSVENPYGLVLKMD
ncbi:MAG: VWA-like domain-containing protein [Bacilli bacterium]|nr:VWA-like domain-containing protein [Bacilli bacterium]